jgi:hypothetical protein
MRLQMPLLSQYKYDDVIEAYVVSSDEAGNFQIDLLSNFGDMQHQC